MSRLLHPDLAHFLAARENDARTGASIDDHFAGGAVPLAERAGKFIANSRYIPPTFHEQAQSNPILRALLRELQG
jgi:hypothetical protein